MAAGLCQVKDQYNRGVAYRYYTENAFSHPAVIGAHWFQWSDQANTGRNDGENYNIGIIDVTDRPYKEMVDAITMMHKNLYMIHSGEKPPSIFCLKEEQESILSIEMLDKKPRPPWGKACPASAGDGKGVSQKMK